jgi:LPXTG-motif cell wall-anchored protein
VGSTGGEWMAIALTRAGLPCPEGYYDNVVQFVRDNINDKEQLHRSKSTENSRVILALTAAGYDVTDVDGHNLLMGLTDMKYVPKQGVNGAIWALIAFDSHGYEIPTNSDAQEQVTREKLIAHILDKQLADGGWSLSGQAADPDMTGMALQALAPYYQTNDAVKAAVDKALACLSDKQMDNGGFGSIDGICTESCAQVIVALTALGIDPETDPRFVKNGVSVVDAMCLFALEGGGFAHMPNDTINGMATEQGEYALASYFRFKNGETSLYDLSDVRLPNNTPPAPVPAPETGDSAALTLFTAMLLTSAAALAVVLQRKKKYAQ